MLNLSPQGIEARFQVCQIFLKDNGLSSQSSCVCQTFRVCSKLIYRTHWWDRYQSSSVTRTFCLLLWGGLSLIPQNFSHMHYDLIFLQASASFGVRELKSQ